MSTTTSEDREMEWLERYAAMNEEFLAAYRESLDAQRRLTRSWLASIDSSTDERYLAEGLAGGLRATEVLFEGAQEALGQFGNVAEGESIEFEAARDIWLNAANEAMKELTRTDAFAHATGETADGAMDLREQWLAATEATLHAWGLPSEDDLAEVGERLVEIERRQHAVERQLERIADHLDERSESG